MVSNENREGEGFSKDERKTIVTLIGIKQARVGYQFIFNNPSVECMNCNRRIVCLGNLESGRVYEVTGLRDRLFPCEIHADGVRVVEVTESDIYASIPKSQALEGATIKFKTVECDVTDCSKAQICFPIGLYEGEKCKIIEVDKNFSCPKGLPLAMVLLRRVRNARKTQ